MCLVTAFTALTAFTARLQSQCPDGTPPPCARNAVPLDERRWIIVPFDNVSHAPDAEWLGSASVNLLYLNLSQWRDLRVVDDERVADLLRGRPRATMGLAEARGLARRAGAGRIVMGDLLKTGSQLTVVGKVYRVRDGERVRQFTVQVPAADSVIPAYRALAAGLLDLPPSGATGGIGTASLDAFRDYARGMAHLRTWELDSAVAAFRQAIASDSTFALGHYQLARTLGWEGGSDSAEILELERAARQGTGLPERERALINGYAAFITGRVEEARSIFRSLAGRDSLDAEAWFSLGETEFHDNLVHRDSAGHSAFGGSWNSALADFKRTLALDPAFHLAFGHIADVFAATYRIGCDRRRPGRYYCATRMYAAAPVLGGDSLLLTPVPDTADASVALAQLDASARSGVVAHNLAAARDAALSWVQSGPAEPDAHFAYAVALLRTGDAASAAREIALIGSARPRRAAPRDIPRLRAEIAIKQERYAEAYAIADSLFTAPRDADGGDAGNGLNALLGRFARWDQRAYEAWPAELRAGFGISTRALAGFLPPNYGEVEEAFLRYRARSDPGFHPERVADRVEALAYSWIFGLRFRPRAGLAADTSGAMTPAARTASALVLGDTAAARRYALRQEERPDDGLFGPALNTMNVAEVFLELGDTARARADLARLERDLFPGFPIEGGRESSFSVMPAMWGRAFLLQGDLAAAQHDRDTMIRAYRRVVGLWSTGDAEVQPSVARARAALVRAGVNP